MTNINEKKLIGKCGDLYMVAAYPLDEEQEEYTMVDYAYVVDKNGKQLTEVSTIDFLLRTGDDLEWEKPTESYEDVFGSQNKNAIKDGLIGFAVGDALGVPVEFMTKEEVRKVNVTNMMGHDTDMQFKSRWSELIPAGSWSDDTSMILATMDSITENNGVIDYDNFMKNYIDWVNHAKFSSLPFSFGLGNTVYEALKRHAMGKSALESGGKGIRDNGNGSLMRIFPISMYCIEHEFTEEETAQLISEASQITHGHDISKMSCFIYTEFLRNLLETKNPHLSHSRLTRIDYSKYFSQEAIDAHKKVLNPSFEKLPDEQINGSGYVVDTLECSLYSLLNSENYEQAVTKAINTGYDTDTIAGITGSLAGVLYGSESIPERWVEPLRKRETLEFMAEQYKQTLDDSKKKVETINSMLVEQEKQDNDLVSVKTTIS